MRLIIYSSLAFILLAAENCAGDKVSSEAIVASEKIAETTAKLGIQNVEKFNGRLDELLTLEMASKCTGYEASEATKNYSQVLEDPKTHYVSYSWEKGRMHVTDLGFTKIETDKPDVVQLSWLTTMTLENFTNLYREITDEDISNARKALDERINKGDLDPEAAKLAKEMAEGFMAGKNSREWVEGVGEKAVWMEDDKSLKVLYNGLSFSILADISDEQSENRQTAIDIAKMIVKDKL
ncbi:hypothetical protein MM213_08465 [Belliella sp. R4-6]|uniref:Uncharacterized protein n=1 Tax=Belliella alkalica TaxID=1730871 RepID=A0ABS9VBA1_9BACT|nr:hypothetical protein [Belliella alkalica]MCH7413514.1 hypothetical protein [Belliella alkalica]